MSPIGTISPAFLSQCDRPANRFEIKVVFIHKAHSDLILFVRKNTLLAMNSLSIVGAIMMGASKAADSITLIIIARFILGVFAGKI